MIDRTPDLAAARAAASSALADSELGSQTDSPPSAASPGPSSAGSAATPSSGPSAEAFAASREQLIRMGAMLVLNLSVNAAQRWGAHWVYTEAECMNVSAATLGVVEHYFPNFDHPVVVLAVALGATALPRMMGPKLPPLVVTPPPGAAPATPGAGQPASSSTGQPASTSPAPAAEELRAAA